MEGVEVQLHLLLTLALYGGKWLVSPTARFTPGVRAPRCPLNVGRSSKPVWTFWRREQTDMSIRIKMTRGITPRTVAAWCKAFAVSYSFKNHARVNIYFFFIYFFLSVGLCNLAVTTADQRLLLRTERNVSETVSLSSLR